MSKLGEWKVSSRTNKVKVYKTNNTGMEIEEVNIERARQILLEARGKGRVVIDKKIGEVIEDLKPNTEELLIIDLLDGG